MSSNELSLLWRLRADASQGKVAVAETRAAVAQLRQTLGPELTQSVTVANQAFSSIADNLNVFVSQRIPLVGGAFVRVTENLRGFGSEAQKQEAAIRRVSDSITDLSGKTGKSVPVLTQFLTQFAKIEGQANRDAAALKFFGAEAIANNQKLIPAAEAAAASLSQVATESTAASAGVASMAGPIGIAVVALAAMAVAAGAVAKQLFDLSKNAAEFQGKMFDLSQQTGVQVETLSALEIVAKTTGGEVGNLTQSLIAFQRKLEEAQDPSSKAAESFRKLGVEANDTETALRATLTALSRMPEGFSQTNAAAELFGSRGGKQMLAILKEADGDLDAVIAKARELSILIDTDAARAADKFNDELALLEFQLRATSAELARELIPAFTDAIRAFSDLVRAGRPLLEFFGTLAGPIVRSATKALEGVGLAVAVLTNDYKALAEAAKRAREEVSGTIPALNIPAIPPAPLPQAKTPQELATEARQQADAIVAAAKRTAAEQSQILAEQLQKGQIRREQEAAHTIRINKQLLDADRARIDALINQKNEEARVLDRESDAYKKLAEDIGKLQQELLDKESEFNVQSRAIRAKANKERADSLRNQAKNETEVLLTEFDRQIKLIENQQKELGPLFGLDIIEQLEDAKIEARRESLEEQKRIGFLTVEEQREINNQLTALGQEADQLDEDQKRRRLEREREAAEELRQIKLTEIDTLIQLQQIGGQRLIDILKSLADARVLTEEEAARRITQIRLDLIDQEIEATKAKLKSTASVADLKERARLESELNNQLKILQAERAAIQSEGNRDIEQGRRDDVDNERRYANDLLRLRRQVADIQRDTAQEVINLMVIHHARRRDILRAQLELDKQDEEERHRQELEGIRAQEAENRESNRTQEEKDARTEELNRLREAEAERHRLAMKGITDQGKKDEDETSPFGRIDLDVENLKEFARVLEDSVVPLADILTNAFQQVSSAIGQVVSNWVLLGTTGPAVMRKILAAALASIAAEAAVNAIKELALGFATLFFNPAESAGHFTAAALWASIGGVAAVAGRSVAGNLFRQQATGTGGGTGARGSGGGSGEVSPIDITRNRQREEVHIFLHTEPGAGFPDAVVNTFVRDIQRNGETRQAMIHIVEGA